MSTPTPPKRLEFVISPKGDIRGIYSPEANQILRNIAEQNSGEISTRRASHVEPTEELRDEALRWLHGKAVELIGPGLVFNAATFRAEWNTAFPGRWWADLTPVNGPVLGPYGPNGRDEALADEITWLKANGIPFCEPCIINPGSDAGLRPLGGAPMPPGVDSVCHGINQAGDVLRATNYMRSTPDEKRGELLDPPSQTKRDIMDAIKASWPGKVFVVDSLTGVDAADPDVVLVIHDEVVVSVPAGSLPYVHPMTRGKSLLPGPAEAFVDGERQLDYAAFEKHISQRPYDIAVLGRCVRQSSSDAALQNLPPSLLPEKQKQRKAFLTGAPPDPPKRRGRSER